ncbi:uncharacterized protein LOC115632672 [Scaptodrosophila lebanonensis]|uniref:Uncharacterized protein LOC115632672 n=1 Tax=Drosophila lebanonensis TaxID=7225 RepID=A0A6J2UB89_DROLE|nr:uncharacterized protein LOC115632672 [Scaptodrosophila lebanonensis]
MSWRLLLCLLNVLAFAAAASRFIQPREANLCEGRQSPGPICESCDLLATCVRHSSGWVNIPVEICDAQNGYYCNSQLGACSNATGPCHPFGIEGNFQCTSQGIFPDPYDCQKYHMCYFVAETLVAAAVDCANGKAFDTRSGQCTLSLQSSTCIQKQYDCPYGGYVAPWPTNPNIFYVCKSTVNQNMNDSMILYPSLHRCADGEVFEQFVCRGSNNLFPTQNTLLNPIMPTMLPDDSDMDPNDNAFAVIPERCEHVGLMADGDNCRKYYYCSAVNMTVKHIECPSGTFYKPESSSCVLGAC